MDLEETARLLSTSFLDYPVMTALAGSVARQRRVLPYFFRCCTRHAMASGGALSAEGGAALWLNSQLGPSAGESIRCGLLALPFRVGFDRVRRAALHEQAAIALMNRAVEGPYGCLWFVGVKPELHGKGVARGLVDRSLDAMAARGLRQCVLTTEREQNVTIWSRCGFEVRGHTHVTATDLPLWLMTRPIGARP
ncbi:MAG: GNAT family N-acetyltransferase [Deltaproteobacteria bacterium]